MTVIQYRNPRDYEKYLLLLKHYSRKYDIQIIAYALMEWHIHLFIFDRKGDISNFIKDLHGHYAMAYNHYHERTSHVFGSRFKNKVVDANNYGIWLSRYIHRQALEAGLVTDLRDYQWTSYSHYIGKKIDDFVENSIIITQFGKTIQEQISKYSEFVLGDDDGDINWEHAQSNPQLVIGSKIFIKSLAAKLNRPDLIAPDIGDALKQINTQYNISLDDLRYPQNRVHRALRRRVICYLSKDYGIGAKKIAELLDVSVGMISMVLHNKF